MSQQFDLPPTVQDDAKLLSMPARWVRRLPEVFTVASLPPKGSDIDSAIAQLIGRSLRPENATGTSLVMPWSIICANYTEATRQYGIAVLDHASTPGSNTSFGIEAAAGARVAQARAAALQACAIFERFVIEHDLLTPVTADDFPDDGSLPATRKSGGEFGDED